MVGDNGFHPHALKAVEEADVLLYVGCKMGSVSTIKWSLPSPRAERKIVQIDLDPTVLANNYENTLSVAGDAKLVLEDLLELVPGDAKPASATQSRRWSARGTRAPTRVRWACSATARSACRPASSRRSRA